MSLAYAVCGSALGYIETPEFPVILPPGISYIAQSPSLFKELRYDEKERWNEIERIAKEADGTKFSIGQQLYYQIHFFANPRFLWEKEYDDLLEEFQLMESLNIPFCTSLNDAPAQKLRDFLIIKTELLFVNKHLMEKNSGK